MTHTIERTRKVDSGHAAHTHSPLIDQIIAFDVEQLSQDSIDLCLDYLSELVNDEKFSNSRSCE